MSQFKIALLTDGISPYVLGGMQKHSFYLAKYFAQLGIEVHLYHMNQSDYDISKLDCFTEDEKKNIKSFVVEFPKPTRIPGHYIKANYQYSEKIFEIFKQNSSDVNFIYSKGFTAWKLIEEKQKGFNCAPIGVNFHGYEMFQDAPNLKIKLQHIFLLRKPVKWIAQNSDFLFSYGGKITPLIENLNIPKSKIIEVPTGIGNEHIVKQIKPSTGQRNFIFMGRDERRKGIFELNEAIQELLQHKDFNFTFIGPIKKENKINHPKVIYLGEIRNFDLIKQELKKCDVLVCPSYSEGMPNVILEAMSQGLAIIATDVGAISTCVDLNNGILITSANSKLIQNAVEQILNLTNIELDKLKMSSLEKCTTNFEWLNIAKQNLAEIKQKLK